MPGALADKFDTRSVAVALMIVSFLARRGKSASAREEESAFSDLLNMATGAMLA